MEKNETCARCGFRVNPDEANLDRTAGGQQIMHALTECFRLTNDALSETGLPIERRGDWALGGGQGQQGGRGQARERDPTHQSNK